MGGFGHPKEETALLFWRRACDPLMDLWKQRFAEGTDDICENGNNGV
jgi:hypothetical protein